MRSRILVGCSALLLNSAECVVSVIAVGTKSEAPKHGRCFLVGGSLDAARTYLNSVEVARGSRRSIMRHHCENIHRLGWAIAKNEDLVNMIPAWDAARWNLEVPLVSISSGRPESQVYLPWVEAQSSGRTRAGSSAPYTSLHKPVMSIAILLASFRCIENHCFLPWVYCARIAAVMD